MKVTYAFVDEIQADEVSAVFRKSGLKRPVEDSPRIQQMLDNSNVILTARVEGKLVGIARGLTDFAWCCYLSDLAVDKTFQRQGIGKELIRRVQERLGEGVKLLLVSAPTTLDYYARLGFVRVDRAYNIPRRY